MKLSEAKHFCNDALNVITDCEFDSLYLMGKEIDAKRNYISFIGQPKYIDSFLNHDICGVICTEEVANFLKNKYVGGISVAEDPKKAFFEIHNHIGNKAIKGNETYIDKTANIGRNVIINETDVYIGKNVSIGSNTVIHEGTYIEDNTIIREGCVIGGPAFYYYGEDDERKLVRSTGTVRIGKNVELHANVIVERGVLYGETYIGNNSKIDNSVFIGHDCKIGKNCTLAGNCMLAGGVTLGRNAFLGVSTTISPNVILGDYCKASSGAVITKNVDSNKHVSGNFAISHEAYIRHIKSISK